MYEIERAQALGKRIAHLVSGIGEFIRGGRAEQDRVGQFKNLT
jgi:hypothetical protein